MSTTRARTTPGTNTGSFAPHARAEAEVRLEHRETFPSDSPAGRHWRLAGQPVETWVADDEHSEAFRVAADGSYAVIFPNDYAATHEGWSYTVTFDDGTEDGFAVTGTSDTRQGTRWLAEHTLRGGLDAARRDQEDQS